MLVPQKRIGYCVRCASPEACEHSCLRERAEKLLNAWSAMGARPWATYRERLVDIITEALTAIRAEAKAEGWDEAVEDLRRYFDVPDIADWLVAANRPSPTGRVD